ncbi:MAG: hypothetical protein FJ297_10875 [Planctomycetes bacterium]|nr:hypothetical protein [Planctomycetota bacterium]
MTAQTNAVTMMPATMMRLLQSGSDGTIGGAGGLDTATESTRCHWAFGDSDGDSRALAGMGDACDGVDNRAMAASTARDG